ncbi:TPA: hypothetical protein ON183_005060 [Serratia marcescens]|nr:hypothetical protein [Serratia marcescens]HCR2985401.1 hypothetical protein [Serratia marcescens]HCR2986693.1 hypothetical protein [Serratia marcescens]HCR3010634.1 hypothetical protein [Serratia marcescens]HCR3015364.1 hypothetical protein [Serratia marcescens]
MLEIESLAALDGVNDKMHEYEIYAAWREWHYRQALLQQVNRRQTVGVQRFSAQASWYC